MIDHEHDLSITRQANVLKISRGNVYYLPRPVSPDDLALKPTSTRCGSARQPNPGRRSTYRRGDSAQTIGSSSYWAKTIAHESQIDLPMLDEREAASGRSPLEVQAHPMMLV